MSATLSLADKTYSWEVSGANLNLFQGTGDGKLLMAHLVDFAPAPLIG